PAEDRAELLGRAPPCLVGRTCPEAGRHDDRRSGPGLHAVPQSVHHQVGSDHDDREVDIRRQGPHIGIRPHPAHRFPPWIDRINLAGEAMPDQVDDRSAAEGFAAITCSDDGHPAGIQHGTQIGPLVGMAARGLGDRHWVSTPSCFHNRARRVITATSRSTVIPMISSVNSAANVPDALNWPELSATRCPSPRFDAKISATTTATSAWGTDSLRPATTQTSAYGMRTRT